jgi:hypothetical protein
MLLLPVVYAELGLKICDLSTSLASTEPASWPRTDLKHPLFTALKTVYVI